MHASPNNAEIDSYVYDAEEWLLSVGGIIPRELRFPCMFQGMLDDYGNEYEPSQTTVDRARQETMAGEGRSISEILRNLR
jgi:hypothetical protein